jgi:site-specific recombinase XerD
MSAVRVCRAPPGRVEVVDHEGRPLTDCSRFLERLQVRGLSPHTVESYAYDLTLAYRWLAERRIRLENLRADDLHQFIAWERGRASHPKSINRRLGTLRLYYRFVMGAELPGGVEPRRGWRAQRDRELGLQRLPQARTRQVRVKEPKTLVEPLTVAQVRELLQSLYRYRDLAIAYLMLLCGLRSNETLQLRMSSVDLEDRRVRVYGKGSKERMMPMPKLVIEILRRYLALERPPGCTTDRLFVVLKGRHRGQPMTRAALRKIFRSRRDQTPALENANPHRLRHTFGTDMARGGVRLPVLQRMMGHAHAETTLQYVNLSAADIAAEFDRAIAALEARYDTDTGEKP